MIYSVRILNPNGYSSRAYDVEADSPRDARRALYEALDTAPLMVTWEAGGFRNAEGVDAVREIPGYVDPTDPDAPVI